MLIFSFISLKNNFLLHKNSIFFDYLKQSLLLKAGKAGRPLVATPKTTLIEIYILLTPCCWQT